MLTKLSALLGTIVAILLVVLALWGWGDAVEMTQRADRPLAALWAIRSGAIAAFAAAQVLGMTYFVGSFYGRGKFGEWLRVAVGFVCTAALITALGLGLVSK
ncbi:MAG TPA: hypothetical protein VKK61_08595 [Tepidisphaeraceae bacterium]|jgi:hypothetical protein|nr:hypothetical protein [Tepidisphaeraceae bacterium]